MVPQSLGNGTERGYYIFFDIKLWQRERVSEIIWDFFIIELTFPSERVYTHL